MSRGRILATVVCAAALAFPGSALADSLVSIGSSGANAVFPQNKQNEPAVAIDPLNPNFAIAGSNDEIDELPCNGSSCPFVPGIGNSGVYWSSDGGGSWTQPNYTGYSGRSGTLGTGPIGTLPNYDTVGLVSDGDPAVAWGPAAKQNGKFTWAGGERAYYANLVANFASTKKDEAIKGYEAIAVSHTLVRPGALTGTNSDWSKPAVVSESRQSSSTFSDKEAVWADNAQSSPFFGNVYVCWTDFRSATTKGFGNAPIMISRSTDGGETWSKGNQLTAAHNNASVGGRQGCDMRTDSNGNLYVLFSDAADKQEAIKETRSFDGGRTFAKPFVVSFETTPGGPSKVRNENDDYDGVAGARSDAFPHLSVANGAPSGTGAPNTLALAWADGSDGLNSEHVYSMLSSDGGSTWSDKHDLQALGDRGLMPAISLSPNGRDLYLTYDGVRDPFRYRVLEPEQSRQFQPVVRHFDVTGTALTNYSTLFRGGIGDGRASSANGLIDEFLGDYNMVSATNSGAAAVYISAQDADQCQAINRYRQSLVDQTDNGAAPGTAPAPATDCANRFGNTDIRGSKVSDPTP